MRQLIDRIFPRMCVLCGYLESSTGLCNLCMDLLPVNDKYCCVCGQPVDATAAGDNPCGACQVDRPAYDRARAPCRYEFPIDAAIKQLKFRRRSVFAPPLAGLLEPVIEDSFSHCDVLVPVPLHRWRQAWRGFNQARELCRPLSRRTGLAILDSARRCRPTPPQSGLHASARSRNLRGAFHVITLGPYRHPLIVDDVMTTGATCNELARELKCAGAETVCALAVARSSGR